MTQAAVLAASASPGTTTGFKNRIINGQMWIDQRNGGASGTATGYCIDRWNFYSSLSTKGTWQQVSANPVTSGGNTYCLGFTSNSSYSVTSGDFFTFSQFIEGYNIADLAWGTSGAKTITISAWVYTSLTGTFGGAVRNGSNNYSYPFTYTISSANTWTQISVTVPGPTSGTFATNNTTGFALHFGLGVGSTYSGTAGSWSANNYVSATGAVSVVGTNGATFYLTGVQLEVGTTATNFDFRSYGTELALCQRYFISYKASDGGSVYAKFALGMATSTAQGTGIQHFPVAMRTSPSLTVSATASQYGIYYVAGGDGTCSSVPTLNSNSTTLVGACAFYLGSGLTAGQAIIMQANNNTSAYLNWSAEL